MRSFGVSEYEAGVAGDDLATVLYYRLVPSRQLMDLVPSAALGVGMHDIVDAAGGDDNLRLDQDDHVGSVLACACFAHNYPHLSQHVGRDTYQQDEPNRVDGSYCLGCSGHEDEYGPDLAYHLDERDEFACEDDDG